MDELHLDFETRSELELDERGLDNYLRHPSTTVLMLAWAYGDEEVALWQPHCDGPMPSRLREGLEDPLQVLVAWNSGFEKGVLQHRLGIYTDFCQWRDPMVHARYLSMPGSLGAVGEVIGLSDDQTKMEDGKRLIKLFCSPATPAVEGGLFGCIPAGFRDWTTDPADWKTFGKYCKQDVRSERAIDKRLQAAIPFPDSEYRIWVLDQIINERGMPCDLELVRGAQAVTLREMTRLKAGLREITNLENANSTEQMLAWAREEGYPFSSLGKAFVARAFAGEGNLSERARKALEIRAQTSKSAVHKFTAIADNVAEDGRLRNQFVYGGAARTARWSGRSVQLQNLTKPTKDVEPRMDRAIALLVAADYESIAREFKNPLDVVTSCTRPAFRAPAGRKLVISDLSAIESRILGWMSRCDKINEVFRKDMDTYLAFAVYLFDTPYEQLWHEYKVLGDKKKRNISKPGCLGCGYQLSGGEEEKTADGDIIKTGLWGYAHAMGVPLTREEAHKSVEVFRREYPEVVQFWADLEEAAHHTVRSREEREVGPLLFRMEKKNLQMVLPSGRAVNYLAPKLDVVEKISKRTGKLYKQTVLSYGGVNQKSKQWARIETYGGKICENADQAIARDILAGAMLRAEEAGFDVDGHVHDEIVAETDENAQIGHKELECIMAEPVSWAPGLILGAAGFDSLYYTKE